MTADSTDAAVHMKDGGAVQKGMEEIIEITITDVIKVAETIMKEEVIMTTKIGVIKAMVIVQDIKKMCKTPK